MQLSLGLRHYFNYIAAASTPIHASLEFLLQVLHTIIVLSQWLLFYMTIGETMMRGETEMNATTIKFAEQGMESYTLYSQVLHALDSFVCLGFYAVSTVFQLFNGDSSTIYVSWTILFLTSTLPVHYPDTAKPVVVLFP